MLSIVQDWIFWLTGGVFTLAGLAIVVRALFGDRHRGPRCPKCWYDMRGSPGLRCPECGRTAPCERKLLKKRRPWRAALAGMLVAAIGASGCLMPKVRRDGWLSIVPTT